MSPRDVPISPTHGTRPGTPVDVSFLVSCYNEEENVAGALEGIAASLKGRHLTHEIIVVDDASTDATIARVEAYRAAHPDRPVSLYCNKENRGLGWNCVLGASVAVGRYFMLVHGDNVTPTEKISAILDRMGSADIIIPYVNNQRKRPLIRRLISNAFVAAVNLLSGHRLRYYNASVLYLREHVQRFRPRTSGFAFQAEILCQALNHGSSYIEIPFRMMKPEVFGIDMTTSAFSVKNILSVGISLCRIFLWRIQWHFTRFQRYLDKQI